MKTPKRKVIIEFDVETLDRIKATHNNRSNFIRHAVAVYLESLAQKKSDLELAKAYQESAAIDLKIANMWDENCGTSEEI